MEFLSRLLDTSDFPARWHCGNWTLAHGWLHISSDLLIWGAYVAIPIVIVYFVLRHGEALPFPRVLWLFAAFILLCGTTHLIEASIFWQPWYRLSGVVKLATAVVSWGTVAALVPLVPRALHMPKMASTNERLRLEMEERKQAERKAAHLAAIVEFSRDAIISQDMTGTITSWNAGAEKLFGYSAEEVLGQPVHMVFPTERAWKSEAMARIRGGEMVLPFETTGLRKDGSQVPLSASLSPIQNANGEVMGASKIARDITELKRAEAELRAANRDLDEFTYMASHDLQEPVRKQLMFSDVLKAEVGEELSPDAALAVDAISSSARRMQALIQDLLSLSRTGRHVVKLERVALDEVLDRILGQLSLVVEETGAEITRDPLPTVQGDATLLGELYQNLIGNALKFRKPGEMPRIRLTAQEKNGQTVFGVQDNGIGVHPESVNMIFEPFKRASARAHYEGSGIGLAICKKVVAHHGGTLWVESEEGQGAHFQFTLGTAVYGDT